MKRSLLALGVAILAAASWAQPATPAQPAQPADPAKPAAPDKPKAAPQGTVTGALKELDAAAGTLTVTGEGGDVKLKLSPDARVVINGDPGAATALKVGAKVQAVYKKEGDAPFAVTSLLDEASIAIVKGETDGVEATIDAVAEKGNGNRKQTVVSLTTSAGKKREAAVAVTSVILKDGDAAKIDAYKAGDKVWIELRHTAKGTQLKALADQLSFIAFVADHTLQGKIAAAPEKGRFDLTTDGQDNATTPCRLVRGAILLRNGRAAKPGSYQAGDAVYVKYTQKQKGTVSVQGMFTKADWKAYAEKELAKEQAAAAAAPATPAPAPTTPAAPAAPAAPGGGQPK